MESPPSTIAWGRWGAIAVALLVAGGGIWYFFHERGAENAPPRENGSGVQVEIVTPKPGGIPRLCVQPGSVEPYAGAALFAKVSGRLKTLTVDIGSHVNKGQLLAEIEIPELEAQAARNEARVEDAQAKLKMTEARKIEAEAEARAAESAQKLAQIMVRAKSAFRSYRQRQLERIKELVARKAEDQRLQDEQEDYYQSAVEAENAAREKVLAEEERFNAAKAKIQRVEADIKAAAADIAVAQAEWANSKVWVEYGRITSPYDGVITQRGFLQWDFIKAGEQSSNVPIVTIVAMQTMRVVIPVPDRDVPYIEPGKPAVLTFDALPGVTYQTSGKNQVVVSRLANAEDYQTRLMRVEVDVENQDGRLKQGMYGRATIYLTNGAPGAVHIPSAALAGRAQENNGTVRIVRDGKILTVPVKYGMDNGIDVEILSGLTVQDQVVIGMNVPAVDGTAVAVQSQGMLH